MSDLSRGRIRVIVAEGSYMVREFLSMTLDSEPRVELVCVCSDGDELGAALGAVRPDVVVTAIRMPPSGPDDGIRIAARLRETDPEIGVVVLSQFAEPGYALALLDAGSGRRAYLLKDRVRDKEQLIGAIVEVAGGGSVIDPKIVDLLIEARARIARSALGGLTARELEVLAAVAEGKSNGAIAGSFGITKRAVEKHINSLFSKLKLGETAEVSRRVKATLMYLIEQEDWPARELTPGGWEEDRAR